MTQVAKTACRMQTAWLSLRQVCVRAHQGRSLAVRNPISRAQSAEDIIAVLRLPASLVPPNLSRYVDLGAPLVPQSHIPFRGTHFEFSHGKWPRDANNVLRAFVLGAPRLTFRRTHAERGGILGDPNIQVCLASLQQVRRSWSETSETASRCSAVKFGCGKRRSSIGRTRVTVGQRLADSA